MATCALCGKPIRDKICGSIRVQDESGAIVERVTHLSCPDRTAKDRGAAVTGRLPTP